MLDCIHSPSTVMSEMGGYLMDGLKEGIGSKIESLMEKFTEIKEKISLKWDEIKENAGSKWDEIKEAVSEKWNSIKEAAGEKFGLMRDTINQTWGDVQESAGSTWEAIWQTIKGIINKIIGGVEGMVNNVVGGINGMIDGVNSVADYIPGVSDSLIPSMQEVHLPRLASGTVVPPRAGEFAAILGDNKKETEVVSPLSTIRQAVVEGIEEAGGLGGGDIIGYIYLDGRELGKSTVKFVREEKKRTGSNPVFV